MDTKLGLTAVRSLDALHSFGSCHARNGLGGLTAFGLNGKLKQALQRDRNSC